MHRISAAACVFACLLMPNIRQKDRHVQEGIMDIPLAEPINIARIYSDADGGSHFSVLEITFSLNDYAPPAPPISVSESMR